MKNVDCKKLKKDCLEEIAKKAYYRDVKLVVIQVGDDPASTKYTSQKVKAGELSSIDVCHLSLSDDIKENDLLEIIESYNNDEDVNGLIVQLPLPKHLNEDIIINAINPKKDVDGLTNENIGLLVSGKPRFVPCTAKGIIHVIDEVIGLENISEKSVVILGRSKLVGLPLVHLFLKYDVTPTICHSKTNKEELHRCLKNADIVVSATGSSEPFITSDMIKEGAIILDVTTHFNEKTKKLTGDVVYDDVINKAGYVSKVPGGIGQMTVLELMDNTLIAYENQKRDVKINIKK